MHIQNNALSIILVLDFFLSKLTVPEGRVSTVEDIYRRIFVFVSL